MTVSRVATMYYLKCPVSNQKKKTQAPRNFWQSKYNRKRLQSRHYKYTQKTKKKKKTTIKDVKKVMFTMLHQIENIRTKWKQEPKRNSKVVK